MGDPGRPRRSPSGRTVDALLWGTALGASSGAVLGDAIEGVGAGTGAVIGAALIAAAEVITSIRRGPAEPKPLWHRILSSALLMALFGWVLGLIYGPDQPVLTGIICGALVGVLGLRPAKAALGLLVGAVMGALFQTLDGGVEPALVAAAVTLAYRVIAAIAYRGRPLVRVMAEKVPADELRYVVPFEARSMYVGGDYVEQLAKVRGGTFRRNPPDVGILASLDSLDGPTFEAGRVHPLIREFYEHTSRHAPPLQRRGARPRPDVPNRARIPRPLPEFRRQRPRRPDRSQAALFPGTDLRLRRRQRAEDRPQLSTWRVSGS